MRRLTTLFAFLMLCVTALFAQAPNKFTYQAVVRNTSNQLITNTLVGIRVSILQNSATGSVVYSETQMLGTNANGLVTMNIGEGTVVYGSFNNIDWSAGTIFLKSEIDPTGGSNYTISSTQQLLSVPYALYANEAGNSFSGNYNDLTNRPTIPQTVGELANDANYITLEQVPAQVNADWNATSGVAEILNKPTIPSVPTAVSAFTNDAGYITGYTETDPVFTAWDKNYNDLTNKPTLFSGNYNDLTNKPTIPTVPTNVSAFTNDAGYITGYTETDPVFTAWDKSYNDLTNKPTIPTVPTNVSTFNNDAGYITGYTETDPVFTAWDKNYNDLTNKPTLFSGNYNDLTNKPTIPTVPTNVSAFTNDAGYITGYTETDPVFTSWDKSYNDLTDKPTIPTVPTVVSAFTNDAGYLTGYSETDPQFNAWDKNYNDLTNKPTLFSGNYNDLTNKPTIPAAANNAMLTIQRNNSTVGTFTADASSDKTVNISVPTTTSELTNNSGYITADQLNALLNAMNSRMDSLQTVLSAQNVEIASLSNTVDSLGAYADSLGNIVDQCGCGQEENACDVATVTDFDGNVYNTVGIGSQCWMAENLRTTHYSDGTEIPAGDRTSSTSPYYYDCSITDVPLAVRGYLYNWPAAMHGASSSSANPSGVQGICPAGWHLPSHAEWAQLIDYVGSQSQYVCDNNPANVAKALADTTGWLNASITCAVGNDQSANNATGFGAYPAGDYLSGFCGYSTYYADFWSTTEEADGDVFYCRLNRGAPDVTLSAYYKERGYSVRCIRNTGGDSDMSQQIIEMQEQMAELQARVDSLSDIVDECGCLSAFHCGTSTISDFDGNAYSTVKLGGQCWMAENLRTTHYSNGDPIDLGATTSTTIPYRYNPASDSTNVGTYGYLYNWVAVMNGAASSEANPSGVQGICPTGWHVPSNAEWTELETFVSSQSQYVCNHQNSSYIGKALASTTGWNNSTSTACGVGTTQSTNNATGFNARPAGNYYASGGNGFGYYANFWTTTNVTNSKAHSYNLSYTSPSLNHSNSGEASGFSVRCVRD